MIPKPRRGTVRPPKPKAPPKPLIEMPIRKAMRLKWDAGRLVYGGAGFIGDPVEELYAELIDALNYCDEAQRQGHDLVSVRRQLQAMAVDVQAIGIECRLQKQRIDDRRKKRLWF